MGDAELLKKKKRLLVKYGFIKQKEIERFTGKTLKEMTKLVDVMSDEEVDKFADIELAELAKGKMLPTGYPNSLVRNHLIYETTNDPIEEVYWFERYMIRVDFHYTDFYKITDVFAATEHSTFWGVSEQRLGLQQDKVSQYLKGISEMIKAMFQIVRELRIIDERLSYYLSVDNKEKDALAAEITLKGIWIDQVEGGAKNPASVYGLASTVGFSILPDIFFRTQIKDKNNIEDQVNKMPFNGKVKEVLKRKLAQYLKWAELTRGELEQRKSFTIKYLKQHYETIKLYISWIKPYLRNIEKLQQDRKKLDSVDMVSFFEGSMAEVEFLATKSFKSMNACLLLNFVFVTSPSMVYQGDGYQRGPMHLGKVEMTFRAYAWDQQQINNYLAMAEEETMQMLSKIDAALEESMDALGGELFKYLEKSGEYKPEADKPGKAKPKSLKELKSQMFEFISPFTSVFGGAKEMGSSFGLTSIFKIGGTKGQAMSKGMQRYKDREEAKKDVKFWVWMAYKNFKKGHKMITW